MHHHQVARFIAAVPVSGDDVVAMQLVTQTITCQNWPSYGLSDNKDGVSFRDMLAKLRREIWMQRIFVNSPFKPDHHKILEPLFRLAAWAA